MILPGMTSSSGETHDPPGAAEEITKAVPGAGWIHGATHIARHYHWIKSDFRWFAWIAGGVASFAVIQGRGFADYPDPRHTLSAFSRRWLGVYPPRQRRIAASVGLVGALGVFAAHVLVQPALPERYPDPDPRYAEGGANLSVVR